jgi:hypothetical protein
VRGHNLVGIMDPEKKPTRKVQWSSSLNRGTNSQRGLQCNTRSGVDGTHSCRYDSRTPLGRAKFLTIGGGATSGPENSDGRYAPRPQGIQWFNYGLFGHA